MTNTPYPSVAGYIRSGCLQGEVGCVHFLHKAHPSVERANKSSSYLRNTLTTASVIFSCFFRASIHPFISYWSFRLFTVVNIKTYLYSRHLFLQSATLPTAGGQAQDVPNNPQAFCSHKVLTSSEKTTSNDFINVCSWIGKPSVSLNSFELLSISFFFTFLWLNRDFALSCFEQLDLLLNSVLKLIFHLAKT